MITAEKKKKYYQALINKDCEYEGIFFVGVNTTGVFCRPTCSAKKPKFQNCEFFETCQQALLASYHPCKRCQPLSQPKLTSPLIQKLVDAVEKNPEKRWKESDFSELSIDASTARRQFKKRFGMTFVAYSRARLMGLAMEQMQEGESVIETQLASGYESGSGFRNAFSRIMGTAPAKSGKIKLLKASWIDSPLGPMIAIADDKSLYLLEFFDRKGMKYKAERLRQKIPLTIIPGHNKVIRSIEKEINLYFEGKLKEFHTPLFLIGTPFQKRVWEEIRKIPFGQTRSYSDLAKAIGKPQSYRAVAQANGVNQLAIIIPCHRVINTNGNLGGYPGGISRKQWLLKHENNYL